MREQTFAPGGAAVHLAEAFGHYGATPARIRAAARAAGVVDEHGTIKQTRFTQAEVEGPILAALRGDSDVRALAEAGANIPKNIPDGDGEPEQLNDADVAEVQQEIARKGGRRRR